MMFSMGNLNAVDLFAGCGGLSLGLHKAGFQGLFAIEKDPMAFETFHHNLIADEATFRNFQDWPSWLPKKPHDITSLLSEVGFTSKLTSLRGEVGLIAGGPPCQGFSLAGARRPTDIRNRLFMSMLETVKLIRPRAVLIENVVGITRPFSSTKGPKLSTADEIVQLLENAGYAASWSIQEATDFGVPQTRQRVFILGVLDSLPFNPSDIFATVRSSRSEFLSERGLPTANAVTAWEAISDLDNPSEQVPCPDSPLFNSSRYLPAQSAFQHLLRKDSKEYAIPDSHRFSRHGERILNLYNTALKTQPPGRLSKEFLLSMGTKKNKKFLIDKRKPVSTITTHPDEFIHYSHPRNITIREMARFQSFPDAFHFKGRYTVNGDRRQFDVPRCSQVGNAVPPMMAEALGMTLKEALD